MKKIFAFAILFAAVSMVACGGEQKKAEDAQEEAPATECCAECEAEKAEACCGECAEGEECCGECAEGKECCGECAEAEACCEGECCAEEVVAE
uniref:hypothetical protein n=1 Tax=Alistipes sp. TaxID=1872444 RepID=UPI004056376A